MRENTRVLNAREGKAIFALLEHQWGYSKKLPYALLQSNSDRLYLITGDFGRIPPRTLNLDAAGLYFGELRNEELRLSIEGSQLIGPPATKNIAEIDPMTMRKWLKGEDIPWSGPGEGFLLIKCGRDFCGTGKLKEGKILNFVPKARRILSD
ncbi:MAG TPA: hypothetical protein VJK52_04525 [Candidatus Nanoarchaeia archaeon]|nr:hypothetical protein [Candidatus Nanoarchaeia archaeon]